ncbi:XRE family transcriptional regulator [Streptomyces sp. S.PB5]|uniref:helix-turn-helix domain-containing protein n=1 Tax=Streptomyces sp. S.PB5 TaxID=3020844 RepID=UPI0025AF46FA|nr:XRE family transcriptional regulator [Streptomyces sp. S.PB5]MDN3028901.1 DUF2690 domain-containing protein [Streptomyces sp. S.PB5]
MTTPSPERARLATALRELKDRTGLSLAGLADETAFSKSSWDRYLKGTTLPPRTAVTDLCRLAGEPEGRCLALWEIAESQTSGRATEPPPPPPVTPPAEPTSRRTAVIAVSVCAVAAAVAAVTTAAVLLPTGSPDPHRPAQSSQSAQSPQSARQPPLAAPSPRCQGSACEGQDPLHMGCGRAPTTLASFRTATGASLELRYNQLCGASWARMWGTRIGDRLEVTADGHAQDARIRDDIDAQAYVYTPMAVTDPGTVVRACFIPATGGKKECFDSRAR